MKTFNDLVFKEITPERGIQAREEFKNGYGVSVVKGPYTYGGNDGLYELAVFKDGELHYDNPVAMGDVRGYLTEEEVDQLMMEVQSFIS